MENKDEIKRGFVLQFECESNCCHFPSITEGTKMLPASWDYEFEETTICDSSKWQYAFVCPECGGHGKLLNIVLFDEAEDVGYDCLAGKSLKDEN